MVRAHMSKIIYLDNNATTPLDPRAFEAMMPYFTEQYANAASNHQLGSSANQGVRNARENVAELIGADASEIIFTSGATEAVNLAIKGIAESYLGKGKHIVTVSTEHPAVLDTCQYLESKGIEITYLPVDENGIVNMDEVEGSIRNETILVSVMLVNNETGVIQPIEEIATVAHNKGALFMTDATQAVGKMPIKVNEMGIDLMAFSGHKFYGPKGAGGLYVRSRRPNKVKIGALVHGGGHERGMRSGTLNVPGIVGLGKATEVAVNGMKEDRIKITELRQYLERELLRIPDTLVNGHHNERLYNVTNICFRGADADAIIAALEDIAVSNGSACSSVKVEPSHVLVEMGLSPEDAYSSIRYSLGRQNTMEEIRTAVEKTRLTVEKLRAMKVV